MAALRYMLNKDVPLVYSRKSRVVKIKKILWLKKAMVARPRSRKLQEKIPSLFTRPECFHKRAFSGDCSNRHMGSQSPLPSRYFYCAIFACYSPMSKCPVADHGRGKYYHQYFHIVTQERPDIGAMSSCSPRTG